MDIYNTTRYYTESNINNTMKISVDIHPDKTVKTVPVVRPASCSVMMLKYLINIYSYHHFRMPVECWNAGMPVLVWNTVGIGIATGIAQYSIATGMPGMLECWNAVI